MTKKPKKLNKTARRGQFETRIAINCNLGARHKQLTLELTNVAADCFCSAQAGQFIQIACRDLNNTQSLMPLLRRPFSIAAVRSNDRGMNSVYVDIIYRVLGPGTNWLAHRRVGENINILGPLGNGFVQARSNLARALLVGGGVGLPPMFFLAQQLARHNHVEIIGFAGARSVDEFAGTLCMSNYANDQTLVPQMVMEQFSRWNTGCVISTDDGSCGFSGTIVGALQEYLKQQPIEKNRDTQIFACGPDAMLKAVAQLTREHNLPCQVCMEAYMACGIGLCQSCAVRVQNEREDAESRDNGPVYKLVCSNGPVFDANSIIWD